MGFSTHRYLIRNNTDSTGLAGRFSKLPKEVEGNGDDQNGEKDEGKRSNRNVITRLITVEPVILLYYMAYQASQPIQQQYLYRRLIKEQMNVTTYDFDGIGYSSSSNSCGIAGEASDRVQLRAQAISAMYSMAFGLATVLPALFTTVLLGSYSDRAGRKWAIIPPALGDVLQTMICLLVTIFELPLPLLIVGQFCEGIMGSASLILSASFAYIADVTTREQRAFRIVIIDILLGVGNMAANVAIGHIIHAFGYTYSFLLIFIMNAINFIYIVFFLPETIKRGHNIKLFSLVNYKKAIQLYTKRHETPRRAVLSLGLLAFAVYMISDQANSGPLDLYMMKFPLCWNSVMIGYYQAVNVLVRYVMSFVLLHLLIKPLSESGLLVLGCVSCILYDLVLSQAKLTWIAFIAPVAGFGMELVTAMIRAITSKIVSQDEQGALFSGQAWISLLCGLTGAISFNVAYAKTVSIHPGFVFYLAMMTFTLLTLMACALHYILRKRKDSFNSEGKTVSDMPVQDQDKSHINQAYSEDKSGTRTRF